jgi:hypothetical protein
MLQRQRRRDCHACGPDGPGCDKCSVCIVCKKRFFCKTSSRNKICEDCKGTAAPQQDNALVETAQECAKKEGALRKQAEQKCAELQQKIMANRAIVVELQHNLRTIQQTLRQKADAHAQELLDCNARECQLRTEIYYAKYQASIMTLVACVIMCMFLGFAFK